MRGDRYLIQLIVSILLFFVMFFGLAFILNMLLRKTWLMSFLYPIVVIMIVDDLPTTAYFTNPGSSFSTAYTKLMNITPVDIIVLSSGLAGTIIAGVVIKILRRNGYQMF